MPLDPNLPLELLDNVLEHLETADIFSACLVNSTVRSRAQVFLYRDITIQSKHNDGIFKIALLFIKLLKQRHLGERVRYIDFRCIKPYAPVETWNYSQKHRQPNVFRDWWRSSEERVSMLQAYLEELDVELVHEWKHSCRDGVADTYIAMILTLLPNLRVLRLACHFQVYTHYIGIIFRRAILEGNPRHGFKSLRTLDFGSEMQPTQALHFDIDSDQLVGLLSMPNLKSLTAMVPNHLLEFKPDSAQTSNLQHLELKGCCLKNESLAAFLNITSNLRSLWLTILLEGSESKESFLFHGEGFASALRMVSRTLRVLRISVECDYTNGLGDIPRVRKLREDVRDLGVQRELLHFKELRELELPLVGLFGWFAVESLAMSTLLPPGLTSLALNDDCIDQPTYRLDEGALINTFRDFFANMHRTGPMLDFFALRLKFSGSHWLEEARERVAAACRLAVVNYEVNKTGRDVHGLAEKSVCDCHTWLFHGIECKPLRRGRRPN